MKHERGLPAISSDTKANQAKAADPAWSIWVEANAGSGKTHVLTLRVLRLLLANVAPQSILCLTYTKAAAAEMRRRVSELLAGWAMMSAGELDAALAEVSPGSVDDAVRARARTLFARALETPGGLKIVTIHAFCESVLHRFPLEAQVPFDFKVIEDEQKAAMILAAREAVLAEGLKAGPHADAVDTLFALMSDHAITKAIEVALADGRKLKAVLADRAGAKTRLRALVEAGTQSLEALQAQVLGQTLLSALDCREVVQVLDGDPSKNSRFVDILAQADPDQLTAEALFAAFFTATGPRATLMNATQQKAYPHIFARLSAEQERLIVLKTAIASAQLVARSEAMLDVVGAISDRYEARKRAQALLDFDDLVEKLGDLFENSALGQWVQYKLDAGIDHILVDESQDTNPEQWRVVTAIADEFFVGAGAVTRPRSLFAVGDPKQSIYSFQGAEPALFGETGTKFGRRAQAADHQFAGLRLHTSFRTLPAILKAVDLVADRADIQLALLAPQKVHHDTARTGEGGMVTLWPPIQHIPNKVEADEWPIKPADSERSAPRLVAEKIATSIASWISGQRPLGNRNRAVRGDDVLILVQSRKTLFHEIIRALRLRGIPTPGADRLKVSDHIGVMDLLALCDVLLNPADDLQLAALLRSPLFDISEDDLFALAQPRAKDETLWQALHASALPAHIPAAQKLHRWRGQLDFERPYEFLAAVLYAEGGLKRFHARLGTEVDDVFAELLALALDHEQKAQPSLQGFVAAMRASDISIKRELADAGTGVRVMTVHGAKGLEAPIVILADATSKPGGSRPLQIIIEPPGPMLVLASSDKDHVPQTRAQRDSAKAKLDQEYWRKLYVGMTRAEDELYVTGALTAGSDAAKQLDGTWYAAIDAALRPLGESQSDDEGQETALVYPMPWPLTTSLETNAQSPAPSVAPRPIRPVPAYADPIIINPSTVYLPSTAHLSAGRSTFDHAIARVADAETARKSGIALHALLEHLGGVDRALWPLVVPKALSILLPDLPGQHKAIGAKAISILNRPELDPIFGKNSRAEIGFSVAVLHDGAPARLVGRMDRLIVDESGVMVVDYKSDAEPPTRPDLVPNTYQTQLGLYALVAGQLFPNKIVRAYILWTALESLMELPAPALAEARKSFTLQ